MTYCTMGTEGIEPSRLAAHGPKPCSSASSDTSPGFSCKYSVSSERRNYTLIFDLRAIITDWGSRGRERINSWFVISFECLKVQACYRQRFITEPTSFRFAFSKLGCPAQSPSTQVPCPFQNTHAPKHGACQSFRPRKLRDASLAAHLKLAKRLLR